LAHMKIRLTRNTFVEGKSQSVGDELDVKDPIGRSLLSMGKAIEIKDGPPIVPDRVIIDASDGLTEAEISEAARILQEARQATLEATRATGVPKKVSKPRKKG